MKNKILIIVSLLVSTIAWADDLVFKSTIKYRIESCYATGSAAAIGSKHNVNSPLCIATSDYKAEDCYWYFISQSDGSYAIKNASTGEYITRDDNYTNSPSIQRYLHLSTTIEGTASCWNIVSSTDWYGDTYYYFQSAEDNSYYFNVRTSTYVLGAYSSTYGTAPSSSNGTFYLYDVNDNPYDPSNVPVDPVDPDEPTTPGSDVESVKGNVSYVYRADGKMDAFPEAYLDTTIKTQDSVMFRALTGETYAYAAYEIDSISSNAPTNIPKFNSFKFNNKFNPHIIEDAAGMFYGDSLITTSVIGIGKTLVPSFKLDVDAQVFVNGVEQISKKTHTRYTSDVIYTIARRGYRMLRKTLDGEYVMRPFGRETTVQVDFATDHATGTYGVPIVYVTTNDGTSITSKDYYWDGKIRIDGGGVFPDMAETDFQIKGRGNTSWTSTGKAPYHFKFAEATKVLGLKKGKNWNLIANRQKHSMTSNAVAMKMAQLVETAGFNHEIPVELYINGQYRGSYNVTENIRFANNSIDLENETYATMLELDSYYDETYKFRDPSYSLPVNIKEPDLSEGTSPVTQSMIQTSFNRVTAALKNGEDMSFYLDLDYLARFLFVDEFSANFELMHPKSTFLYNPNVIDSDSKFVFGPCWDFDWGFGYNSNYDYFTAGSTVDYFNRTSGNGYTWVKAQRYCGSNFDKIYYKLWYDFVNDGRLQDLIDFCDDYYDYAKNSYTHDNSKWGYGDAAYYATITENCKKWLKDRADHIMTYMDKTLGYASLGYEKSPNGTFTIGDVNGDGAISTADVVCVFNYILGLATTDFDFAQADTDHNDMITVSDLINVRNLIGSKSTSGRFFGLPEAEASINPGAVAYTTSGVSIPITIEVEDAKYSGLQFDLKVPVGMVIENVDLSTSIPDFDVNIVELDNADFDNQGIDRYRVSIYSSANHKLPVGTSNITLELGWGTNTDKQTILATTMADVMFVSSLGEDERAGSRSSQFTADELSGINSAVSLAQQNGTQLTFRSTTSSVLPIYTVDGRVFRMYNLSAGTQTITLPRGIYIINKQKIAVR